MRRVYSKAEALTLAARTQTLYANTSKHNTCFFPRRCLSFQVRSSTTRHADTRVAATPYSNWIVLLSFFFSPSHANYESHVGNLFPRLFPSPAFLTAACSHDPLRRPAPTASWRPYPTLPIPVAPHPHPRTSPLLKNGDDTQAKEHLKTSQIPLSRYMVLHSDKFAWWSARERRESVLRAGEFVLCSVWQGIESLFGVEVEDGNKARGLVRRGLPRMVLFAKKSIMRYRDYV